MSDLGHSLSSIAVGNRVGTVLYCIEASSRPFESRRVRSLLDQQG